MKSKLTIFIGAALAVALLAGCGNQDKKLAPNEQQQFFQKGPPPPGTVPGSNGHPPPGAPTAANPAGVPGSNEQPPPGAGPGGPAHP